MQWMATLVIGLLPAGRAKNAFLRLLNPSWSISRSASIAPVLLMRVSQLTMGRDTHLGTGTVVRDVTRLALADSSSISQWNWISSARPLHHLSENAGSLSLDLHSAITSRHYIDCSGGVTIGAYSVLAGVRSTLVSHGIDTLHARQTVDVIRIEAYCLVSSNVKIAPGGVVPERSVVAMGAVVTRGLTAKSTLYAGVPARAKKPIDGGEYFSRTTGKVFGGP